MADFPYSYTDIHWAALKALKDLGGSATTSEIEDELIRALDLSDEQINMVQENHNCSVLYYRASWARSYLKKVGAIDSTQRGVWRITGKGESIASKDILQDMFRQQKKQSRMQSQADSNEEEDLSVLNEEEADALEELAWMDEMLGAVREMEHGDFERLCLLMLRESGYSDVKGTGGPGDKGIDGTGILEYNLVSFSVAFQCKKYSDSPVTSSDIRDFRGSMAGQDKGLLITSSRFTKDAKEEARRDGVQSIDLMDGEELCTQLKKLGLGIKESVDLEFFQEF